MADSHLEDTYAVNVDHLATPKDLRAWVSLEAEHLHVFDSNVLATVSQADLSLIHTVQECATKAIDHVLHGKVPSGSNLRVLNQALKAAPLHLAASVE